MALPVAPPLQPMLAKLARAVPDDRPYVFEPKWDGFRCLVFRDGTDVDLRSRNQRPLARYFPEIVAAMLALPQQAFVLDGELVVHRGGSSDFAALMSRLHPSASRVSLLAAQTPARLVAFDLLACGSADLRDQPFAVRRTALADLLVEAPAPVVLTPSTTDPREARQWLGAPAGAGIDGVVAKDPDSRYQPGRRVMVKVKHERTVECVVAGFRVFTDRPVVSSLLLGLWDGAALRHVGLVQSFPETARMELLDRLRPQLAPVGAGVRGRGRADRPAEGRGRPVGPRDDAGLGARPSRAGRRGRLRPARRAALPPPGTAQAVAARPRCRFVHHRPAGSGDMTAAGPLPAKRRLRAVLRRIV
jgi:ATP-dependent DNA ligase